MRRCSSGRPRPSRSRKPSGCGTSVLAGFEGGVDYQPSDDGPWLTRIQAELRPAAAPSGCSAACTAASPACPTTWSTSPGSTSAASRSTRTISSLGKLGTAEQKYLPWMQATYIMAANKKALQFLPEGADVNALTYDQLVPGRRRRRGDRLAEARLPGRPRGADAPLLPGLPAARPTPVDGDEVQARRGRGRLDHVPRALAVHQPGLDQLRLHAGAAPDRRRSGSPSTTSRGSPTPSTRSPTSSSPSRPRPGPRAAATCR